MLSLILVGGASKGKKSKGNKENVSIGKKIEMEHVEYETDNKVLKRMQEIFIFKILSDHLTETETYYVDGVNFKDELEREGK